MLTSVLILVFISISVVVLGVLMTFLGKTKTERHITREELLKIIEQLSEKNDIRNIEKICIPFLKRNPKDIEIATILGDLYLKNSRLQDATSLFEKVLKIDSQNTDVLSKMAKINKNLKYYSKATEYYKALLEINPSDIEYMQELAEICEKTGDLRQAVSLYEQAQKLTDTPSEINKINYKIAFLYYKNKRYDESLEICYKILNVDPNNVKTINLLVGIYAIQKNYKKIIEYYEQLKEIDPQNASFVNRLAQLYFMDKNYTKAFENYTLLKELEPSLKLEIDNKLLSLKIKMNQEDEAISELVEKISENPDKIYFYKTLAEGYVVKSNYPKAIEVYDQILELEAPTKIASVYNEISELYCNWAISLMEQNSLREAYEKFNQALKYNDQNSNVYYNIAKMHAMNKSYNEAILETKRAIYINPEIIRYYAYLAFLYESINNIKEAVKTYEELLKIDPTNYKGLMLLGSLYSKIGRINNALVYFEKATEINPQGVDARYNLALAYELFNNKERAIEEYKKVLQLAPNHTEAKNNLATLMHGGPK